MDHEQRENFAFIVFKSIIVFISLCIAGFLIALFCMVSKVEAELIPISAYEIDGPNINWQIVSIPISEVGNGGINYIGVQAMQGYNGTKTPIMKANHQYAIRLELKGGRFAPSGIPSVNKGIFYQRGNGSWLTATPDGNETFNITPVENMWTLTWAFDFYPTVDITNFLINFNTINLVVGTWDQATLNITDYNDTEEALGPLIKNQTDELKENNNGNTQKITNGLSDIKESVDDVNDTLNDDSVSSGRGSAIVNGISSNAGSGLAGIINTPLGVISGLLQQNTCSDIVAPLPFVNQNLTLPCLTPIYEDKFGSFFDIYQVIITGIVAYWVTMNIFLKTKKMSMPDDDRIEVLDL